MVQVVVPVVVAVSDAQLGVYVLLERLGEVEARHARVQHATRHVAWHEMVAMDLALPPPLQQI